MLDKIYKSYFICKKNRQKTLAEIQNKDIFVIPEFIISSAVKQ